MLHTHDDMNKEYTIMVREPGQLSKRSHSPTLILVKKNGHIVTLVGRAGVRGERVRPNSICSATHLSLGQFVVGKKQSLELDPLQYLQNFSGLGENTRLKGSHALKGRGKAV